MSRITFVENRGKTIFWASIARILVARGHTVTWIVQNPTYAPRGFGKACLPFPRRGDLRETAIPPFLSTDRGRLFFGAGGNHYGHYQGCIARAIDDLAPDVLVGEPTLFHEQLILAEARRREIPYLHPTMSRYPAGRFTIFDGDSQNPMHRSGEVWDARRLGAAVEALVGGGSIPTYVQVPDRLEGLRRRWFRAQGMLQTLGGRLIGERFNTPSVGRKMTLNRRLRSNLRQWVRLQREPEGDGPIILYPLQMQPEANIDVWGRPYSDQAEVIRRLLAALPPQGRVVVKANPKSKYEVSSELLGLAQTDRRVVLLPLEWRMAEAHAIATGAVTVSGTVGYEAVFGRGRCLSLRHPVISELFPQCHADTPEHAVHRLLQEPDAGSGGVEDTQRLLRRLVSDSFPGTVTEPAYDSGCTRQENTSLVANAVERAIEAVVQRPAA